MSRNRQPKKTRVTRVEPTLDLGWSNKTRRRIGATGLAVVGLLFVGSFVYGAIMIALNNPTP